jgi:DNA-binding IclR family transcriptional regulator
MSSTETKSVRAVERAIDVLTSFDAGRTTLEIGDLQRSTGLSRPTLYRLLQTLEAKGFIHSHGNPMQFELGPAVHRLAHAWDRSFPVVSVSKPVLEELWRSTGETVALMLAASSFERTCAVELKSPHPISYSRGTGYSDPMHRGASGKAILAFLPATEQKLALARVEPARVREELAAELVRIRKIGYALTSAELVDGVCAIGAPVTDKDARAHASICVFGPQQRMQGKHLKACIRGAVAASKLVRERLLAGRATD